ncbi:hypothetical protein [Flavobacterium sp.]|jgi:hypothetical protein|uniref:hypothetical protein n=1 Tax=Flavobacterium sp. TaxID=239 RepID=UPI0037BFC909
MKQVIKIITDIVTSIKNNPLDIKLLLLFSILMTLASKFLRLESNKDLYQNIIPYTGWSPGKGYFISIVFIIIWSYTIKNRQISTLILRGFFIFSFGMTLSYGITDWNNVLPEDYINANPYLRYTSLTPIYTIALPLFWILIHSSSLLYDFYKKARAIKAII